MALVSTRGEVGKGPGWSVRWHGPPRRVVWKSGQLHGRQTGEALKRVRWPVWLVTMAGGLEAEERKLCLCRWRVKEGLIGAKEEETSCWYK